MQPRPWAETVSSPSATVRMPAPHLPPGCNSRSCYRAAGGTPGAPGWPARPPSGACEAAPDAAVRLRRTGRAPRSTAYRARSSGSTQLADEQEPVQVGIAEPPPAVRAPFDGPHQPDPLVPTQRVLRETALLRGLPRGPAHAIDIRC